MNEPNEAGDETAGVNLPVLPEILVTGEAPAAIEPTRAEELPTEEPPAKEPSTKEPPIERRPSSAAIPLPICAGHPG